MPVLDSVPNALNTTTSSTPYACRDRQLSDGYYLQVRVYYPNGKYGMGDKFRELYTILP